MAVATHNLTNPVLQAIESWSSVQNHKLGYETKDRSTGKAYRYVQYNAGSVTTTIPMQSGVTVGPYVASANGTYSENIVTDDASLAFRPTGVIRSSACSSVNVYGFIEVIEANLPTTILTSVDQAVAQQNGAVWADRHFTTAAINTTSFGVTVVAEILDSHAASKDQAGSTLSTAVTPVAAVFFG